jgi:hypothetical protein
MGSGKTTSSVKMDVLANESARIARVASADAWGTCCNLAATGALGAPGSSRQGSAVSSACPASPSRWHRAWGPRHRCATTPARLASPRRSRRGCAGRNARRAPRRELVAPATAGPRPAAPTGIGRRPAKTSPPYPPTTATLTETALETLPCRRPPAPNLPVTWRTTTIVATPTQEPILDRPRSSRQPTPAADGTTIATIIRSHSNSTRAANAVPAVRPVPSPGLVPRLLVGRRS